MTPDVSVVVPTIRGREDSLERTLDAYRRNTPLDLVLQMIVVPDRPTAGQAWNDGAPQARGRYLHFTGDDLEPHPGWLDAALEALTAGWSPVPRVVGPDGQLDMCGTHGEFAIRTEQPDWTPCGVTTIPFLKTVDYPGPCLPIHYGSDSHFSWLMAQRGARFAVRRAYLFTHHRHPVGRARMIARALQDRALYRAAVGVR